MNGTKRPCLTEIPINNENITNLLTARESLHELAVPALKLVEMKNTCNDRTVDVSKLTLVKTLTAAPVADSDAQ
jgi:hypothetical protein